MDIGTNIRAVRQKRGMTVAQLCEATGLSQGFMSLVENNKTSPSLATLESLATALGVPIGYLLLKQDERMRVVRKDERTYSLFKGKLKIEHLAEIGGLRMFLSEIPPGEPELLGTNEHEGIETHYVLRGKVAAGQGEDEVTLEEGDSFSWHACVAHWVRNIGEEPALLLIVSHRDAAGSKD